MYVNTMNLTVSLILMMFRLHAQFQVNSEGSLQLSVVHSMMIPVPCATCGGETEKRVYPNVTNAEHVPKCTRPALPPLVLHGFKGHTLRCARRRESLGTRLGFGGLQ